MQWLPHGSSTKWVLKIGYCIPSAESVIKWAPTALVTTIVSPSKPATPQYVDNKQIMVRTMHSWQAMQCQSRQCSKHSGKVCKFHWSTTYKCVCHEASIAKYYLPAVTAVGLGQRHRLFEESAFKKRFRQTDFLCIPLIMRVGNIQTCINTAWFQLDQMLDTNPCAYKQKFRNWS